MANANILYGVQSIEILIGNTTRAILRVSIRYLEYALCTMSIPEVTNNKNTFQCYIFT